ncbi:MAG: acyl-CoA dehydrogenase [Desulfococcus sp. 4484_241]|nr:MAG: acyl-CoA dehydrogenase [Desulfococcus sp. 4484_241]
MISRSEQKTLLNRTPRFEDMLCSLYAAPRMPGGVVKETKKVVAIARKFNVQVIRARTLELDKKMHEEPDYLAWDFVREANRWGFYSMWYPKQIGCKGYSFFSMPPFIEEIASACLGMANLIMVHYLGVTVLASSMNVRLIRRLFMDTIEGEKTDSPCIFSTAITEPGAGTDVEETELVDKGNITCYAQKVPGGYRVNGTKVFISNGHLATWHMLIAYSDLKKPSENMVVLAVKNGTKGFSFGKMEKKLGQKCCPASELIFNDCFIPDEYVCADMRMDMPKTGLSKKDLAASLLDDTLAASRCGVGAFGAGGARGAFETALKFAAKTKVKGRLLINHEWAQCILAEMYKNMLAARLAYMESNYANGVFGPMAVFQYKPVYYFSKYMPVRFFNLFENFFRKPVATKLLRRARLLAFKQENNQITAGLGSFCKFSATDLAVKNCHLALEMMGQAGLRHDKNAEKILRDSKLLQIYEGTNQLNRLNLFKCLIARDFPQTVVFDE